jgi:DNA invertase Pin-like site-specific DNA recombinase
VGRVVGYIRVSTVEQADSGAGLDAQRVAIQAACEARGWELVEVYEDAGVSARSVSGRPGLRAALAALRAGEAGALVVSKLDRLSRSAHDATGLLQRAEQEGWALVALDLGLDTSTPVGEMLATVMAAVAQWERRAISERTKAALAAKRAAGVRLGRPSELPAEVVARIVAERRSGASTPAIAHALNKEGVPTAQGGKRWYPSTVAKVLAGQAAASLPAA